MSFAELMTDFSCTVCKYKPESEVSFNMCVRLCSAVFFSKTIQKNVVYLMMCVTSHLGIVLGC